MKKKRLANICRDILARWSGKRSVDEEQVCIFLDGILDTINDPQREPIPDYKKVTAKLQEMHQYKDFDGMSEAEIFLCGGLWGGIQINETSMQRERQEKSIEDLACAYENKQWFFEAIFHQPGIRHKDLAERGGKSTSQLSQFVIKADKEGLITYNRIGREKYYYLEKKGELVFDKIKEKNILKNWDNRLSYKNDVLLDNEIPTVVYSTYNTVSKWVNHDGDIKLKIFKPDIYDFQNMCVNQLITEAEAEDEMLSSIISGWEVE